MATSGDQRVQATTSGGSGPARQRRARAGNVATLAPRRVAFFPREFRKRNLTSAALRRAKTHLVRGQRGLLLGGLRRDLIPPVLHLVRAVAHCHNQKGVQTVLVYTTYK